MSLDVTDMNIEAELGECAYQINLVGKSIAARLPELGMWCAQARDLLSARRDGSFAAWVEDNCEVSLGYCYGAIRVWERFGDCNGCKIDVRAMLLLSSPAVPAEVVEAAIELAETEPVTARKAKELINEHRMEVVRDESPEAGSADYDPGIEPDVAAEHEPVAVKAKAKPLESNLIGDVIRQITAEAEYAIEPLPDYQVAAVFEGVALWMAEQRERRGIK